MLSVPTCELPSFFPLAPIVLNKKDDLSQCAFQAVTSRFTSAVANLTYLKTPSVRHTHTYTQKRTMLMLTNQPIYKWNGARLSILVNGMTSTVLSFPDSIELFQKIWWEKYVEKETTIEWHSIWCSKCAIRSILKVFFSQKLLLWNVLSIGVFQFLRFCYDNMNCSLHGELILPYLIIQIYQQPILSFDERNMARLYLNKQCLYPQTIAFMKKYRIKQIMVDWNGLSLSQLAVVIK